jgi:hypothetical protein
MVRGRTATLIVVHCVNSVDRKQDQNLTKKRSDKVFDMMYGIHKM